MREAQVQLFHCCLYPVCWMNRTELRAPTTEIALLKLLPLLPHTTSPPQKRRCIKRGGREQEKPSSCPCQEDEAIPAALNLQARSDSSSMKMGPERNKVFLLSESAHPAPPTKKCPNCVRKALTAHLFNRLF